MEAPNSNDGSGTDALSPEDGNAELWRTIFADGHPDLRKQQRLHLRLPKEPRCRMCFVPFGGVGGWVMAKRGKMPSSRNAHYCNACDGFLEAFPGGADVELSLLFVDVRNSVQASREMTPAQTAHRINAFLDAATSTITEHDGFIMAFYGDCVVAVWPPGFAGADHAEKAVAAARALVRPGAVAEDGEPIPIGVGVHSGPVHIATVQAGQGLFRDISVFGEHVARTARLAASAEAGEALASDTILALTEASARTLRAIDAKGFDAPLRAGALTPLN